jgi:sulfonate transport system permease protein
VQHLTASSNEASQATGELETPRVRRQPKRTRSRTLALRIGSLLFLFAVWWIVALCIDDVNQLPTPIEIFDHFGPLISHDDLLGNMAFSLWLAFRGFLIGSAIGFALGVAAGLTILGEEVIDAPMQMIRVVPYAALLPLFVLWFGLGDTPKVALIALACAFPTYLQSYLAVRNVDRKVVEASRTFGLSGIRLLREVTLPMALPGILSGLRFAGSVSVLALVIAEQLNADRGIGALLIAAQGYEQWLTVFCIVVVYMAFGILIDLFFRVVEHLSTPWRVGVALR